ncbi:MAG: hypothetical protein JNN27_01500 [Planctomycetes bacterium]|jgi:hypothetical protein|nr:hypothetical protein [Planctomycetota bacterium]
MGKWNEAVVRSAEILTRNNADVMKQMPNLQAFCQTMDALEKLDGEVLQIHELIKKHKLELERLTKLKAEKIEIFKRQSQEAARHVPTYDRALEQYERADKVLKSSELKQAISNLRIGLQRTDGLLKAEAKQHFGAA